METETPQNSMKKTTDTGDKNLFGNSEIDVRSVPSSSKWYWGRCSGCGEVTGIYDRISPFETKIRLCQDCIRETESCGHIGGSVR